MSRPDLLPHPLAGRDTARAAQSLEATLEGLLGDTLHVAVAMAAAGSGGYREHEFRLGRSALARVLDKRGDRSDPLTVRFPHPALSLSHSAGCAVAVGVRSCPAAGVGVDVELPRTVDPRTARYFLADREQAGDPGALQQLWTVKEAVFKADLDNAGLLLRDYRVSEICHTPGGTEGVATRGRRRFGFRSFLLPGLLLAIALPERTSA